MKKNEKTSKKVASEAGKLLASIKQARADLEKAQQFLAYIGTFLEKAESVAGSALTQAADKKK